MSDFQDKLARLIIEETGGKILTTGLEDEKIAIIPLPP